MNNNFLNNVNNLIECAEHARNYAYDASNGIDVNKNAYYTRMQAQNMSYYAKRCLDNLNSLLIDYNDIIYKEINLINITIDKINFYKNNIIKLEKEMFENEILSELKLEYSKAEYGKYNKEKAANLRKQLKKNNDKKIFNDKINKIKYNDYKINESTLDNIKYRLQKAYRKSCECENNAYDSEYSFDEYYERRYCEDAKYNAKEVIDYTKQAKYDYKSNNIKINKNIEIINNLSIKYNNILNNSILKYELIKNKNNAILTRTENLLKEESKKIEEHKIKNELHDIYTKVADGEENTKDMKERATVLRKELKKYNSNNKRN